MPVLPVSGSPARLVVYNPSCGPEKTAPDCATMLSMPAGYGVKPVTGEYGRQLVCLDGAYLDDEPRTPSTPYHQSLTHTEAGAPAYCESTSLTPHIFASHLHRC